MNTRFHNTVVAFVVASVTFMELLDATVLTTALPVMARSLSVTIIDLKMAITIYLVSLSIFIPISGWIADRFGCKTTLLTAIAMFTLSSAACGMSQSMAELVVFRVLQGIGGALMTPVARLVIVRLFDRSELVRIAGLVAMPIVMGPVIGPLVGGYLTTHYSWPWVFFINVPVGVAAFATIAWLAERDKPQTSEPLDVRGFLALGIGLAVITFVVESLDSNYLSRSAILSLLSLSGILLGYAVLHFQRVARPIFDLSLLRGNAFRIGVLQALFGMIACGGVPFLVAVFLQTQLGYSPLKSGFVLFFSAVGSLAIKPWIMHLLNRFGYRRILTAYPLGFSIVLCCIAALATQPTFSHFCALMFCYGCCQSVFMNMANAVPFLEVLPQKLSKATSLQCTALQFAMSLGISFAALLLHSQLDSQHLSLHNAAHVEKTLVVFRHVFLVLASASAINALIGLSFRQPLIYAEDERPDCPEQEIESMEKDLLDAVDDMHGIASGADVAGNPSTIPNVGESPAKGSSEESYQH